MYLPPPDSDAPWGYLSVEDLAHLRGAARRLDRTGWRTRLPQLDACLAEARAQGLAFVRAEACLARVGERDFALHALVRARRATLTWLSPTLQRWFAEALARPGAPPPWTRAWIARPRDRYDEDLTHAGRVLLATIRRDRAGRRGDALRPLVRALLRTRAPDWTYRSSVLLREALAPGGAGLGSFRYYWPHLFARRWRPYGANGEPLDPTRALRRLARIVAELAPSLLLTRRELRTAFDTLPPDERLALLAAPAMAHDARLADWVVARRADALSTVAAAPGRALDVTPARDVARDEHLTDAESRLGPGRVLPHDLALVSPAWIAAVLRTAKSAPAVWDDVVDGLDWADSHVLHYHPELPGLTAAHLLSLVGAVQAPPSVASPAPKRRDAAWRRDRFWRVALATPDVELGWVHAQLHRALPAAVRAERRPRWLQAWAGDARTAGADLVRILDLIDAAVGDDPARLEATRLLHVVRAALVHPAFAADALATPLLEAAFGAGGATGRWGREAFRAAFVRRWGTAALPDEVGVRLLRLFTVEAPVVLPAIPALDAAVAWIPPAEWAARLLELSHHGDPAVRAWALRRAGDGGENRVASVTGFARVHAAPSARIGRGPQEAASRRHTVAFALASVLERYMGEASLVVLPYVDGVALATLFGQYDRARRGYPFGLAEGPFGGLRWGSDVLPFLRGDSAQNDWGDQHNERCDLLSCLGCLDVGCGGIRVRITMRDDVVVWDDFVHAYHREVRFGWVGPFTFDRAQYEASLDELARQASPLPSCVAIPSVRDQA